MANSHGPITGAQGVGKQVSECVFVGIGSNLGRSASNIKAVADELGRFATGKVGCSSLWRSEPVGLAKGAAPFVNAVVCFDCSMTPVQLLQGLQEMEVRYGRSPNPLREGYESRTMDLDILSFGQRILAGQPLTLPHPRAWQRLFVLLPLQELAPEFRFPGRDESLQQLISVAPGIQIELLSEQPGQPG